MQLVSRSYLAAGVALVGASAIAISPLAPPAPDAHFPAIDSSSAAVNLTAAANPLELWAEVIGAAVGNIGGLGEQWMADPAPILTQIIANQLHTANVLGAAAQTTADGLKAALSPDGWSSFPASMQGALDLIAAGDLENGLASAVSSFILLALPLQIGVGMAWPALAQPFVNLGQFALHVNDMVPAILVSGLLSPLTVTAAATGHVIDSLVSAASSGDPAEFATALVNAPATITGALLNGYDVFGTPTGGLLNPPDQWGIGGGISTVLTAIAGIANSIKTPGADRGDLLGNLPGLGGASETSAVLDSTLASTTKTVTLDVTPAKALVAAPAAVETSTPQVEKTESAPIASAVSSTEAESAVEAPTADATDAAADTDAAATEGDDATKTVTKASPKASVKAAKGQAKVSNSAKAVRDQVKSAAKKLTNGLKKDKTGPKKSAEKKAGSSSDSAKGADK
ncbi:MULTISPECIES: hypothetical protein [Mycolicibacterium]|uniref:PE-PGRS family protein n=2 Tax=Mycolicibacterium TaxID=1866885 RepID=A0A6N4UY15_9MYCO|nr:MULTISPECIES: hypothetical protein [Mycolicibacterium]MBP2450700.1 hypothetical protein [Mycolicibacterium lutetiense]MCV7000439.1 hypothetical protein [Mycolicibacterium alvei]BBX29810.1 hypothetical protein MALV_49350 [Mycolicibacterium alvei]